MAPIAKPLLAVLAGGLLLTGVAPNGVASARAATRGDDVIDWQFASLERTLRQAEREQKPVLVYFWMASSANCAQMYETTLQAPEAARAARDFLCFSVNHADKGSAALFETYRITTVPALRVLTHAGMAVDGMNGFADVPTLQAELERIGRGEGTLVDLQEKTRAAPDDLELRNKLAGKFFDLGDQDRHDELQESIKRDDPEGRSEIAAQLLLGDFNRELLKGAASPASVNMPRAYEYVQGIQPKPIAFQGWATIASLENARGDSAAECAALRKAWENLPEDSYGQWASRHAEYLWGHRDDVSKEDVALAVEMAAYAVAEIEQAQEDFGDGHAPALAAQLDLLARCQYATGDRQAALESVTRAAALVPDDSAYARRAEVYESKRPDPGLVVYEDKRPRWSPDGKKILFGSTRNGDHDLYVADVKRGKVQRVTRSRSDESSGCWDSKGKAIVYDSGRFLASAFYTVKPDGKSDEMLFELDPESPVNISDPALSPDGKRVAYATTRNGKSEIAVRDLKSGEEVILTADTPNTDMQPTWDAANDRILFMSNRVGDSDVYAISPDGKEEVNVTNAPEGSWDMDPVASPDGKRIAFASWRSGQCEVYVMDSDGSNVLNLTNSATVDRHPSWSPDGKRLAFDRQSEDGNVRIYLMKSDGSEQEPLFDE